MTNRTWQHPWLRIDLAIRALFAARLTRASSPVVDQVLMARLKEGERIERWLVQLTPAHRLTLSA